MWGQKRLGPVDISRGGGRGVPELAGRYSAVVREPGRLDQRAPAFRPCTPRPWSSPGPAGSHGAGPRPSAVLPAGRGQPGAQAADSGSAAGRPASLQHPQAVSSCPGSCGLDRAQSAPVTPSGDRSEEERPGSPGPAEPPGHAHTQGSCLQQLPPPLSGEGRGTRWGALSSGVGGWLKGLSPTLRGLWECVMLAGEAHDMGSLPVELHPRRPHPAATRGSGGSPTPTGVTGAPPSLSLSQWRSVRPPGLRGGILGGGQHGLEPAGAGPFGAPRKQRPGHTELVWGLHVTS